MAPAKLKVEGVRSFEANTIISTATGQAVSFKALIDDLADVRVIFIGEQHTRKDHHRIQLDIIRALFDRHHRLSVGMEMFDHTYQSVLDRWSAGRLDTDAFLQKTHWYANWRYPFELYQDILIFIKDEHLRLVGLNLPPHIPSKIRVGGVQNLLPQDKKHLPPEIDTSNEPHRAYVRRAFEAHPGRIRGRFDYFYEAQCVWEDTMAENIARNLTNAPMVVLAGNGHIDQKFGIPDRMSRRTGLPYRTVCPVPAGQSVSPATADYIWVTPPSSGY